jgi:hypothetical protein
MFDTLFSWYLRQRYLPLPGARVFSLDSILLLFPCRQCRGGDSMQHRKPENKIAIHPTAEVRGPSGSFWYLSAGYRCMAPDARTTIRAVCLSMRTETLEHEA